jgi:hypothetical protein
MYLRVSPCIRRDDACAPRSLLEPSTLDPRATHRALLERLIEPSSSECPSGPSDHRALDSSPRPLLVLHHRYSHPTLLLPSYAEMYCWAYPPRREQFIYIYIYIYNMHRTIYPARGEPFIEASVCTAGRMSLLDRGMYVRSYCVCVYGRADVAARRTVRQGKARKARWRRCRRFMSTMVDADALTGRCQTMAAVDVWQPVDARVPYALKRRVSSVPRVAHGRVPDRPDHTSTRWQGPW